MSIDGLNCLSDGAYTTTTGHFGNFLVVDSYFIIDAIWRQDSAQVRQDSAQRLQ